MIRFVRMTPELFDFLPVRREFYGCSIAENGPAREAVCAAPNVAVAMLDGGMVMGAGGLVQVWPGRGYAWFLAGEWMENRHFGHALARCRIELDRAQSGGMWRIECSVLTSAARDLAWADRLGFRTEGTMAGFGPDGSDHELMARLSERRSPAAGIKEVA